MYRLVLEWETKVWETHKKIWFFNSSFSKRHLYLSSAAYSTKFQTDGIQACGDRITILEISHFDWQEQGHMSVEKTYFVLLRPDLQSLSNCS